MLSSTSLLHGNCIFNRNNTVATQQGMKTYWLCKSYRLTMCRARCITHRGTVISATGVHNHQPHMKGTFPHGEFIQSGNSTANSSPTEHNQLKFSALEQSQPGIPNATVTTANNPNQASALEQSQPQSQQRQHQAHDDILPSVRQQHQDATQPLHSSQNNPQNAISNIHHSPNPQHAEQQQQHTTIHPANHNSNHSNAVSIQMMQNVLSQNNLMNLSNMTPILNPMQSHLPHLSHLNSAHSHSTDELHVVTSQHDTDTTHSMNSPSSPRNAQLNRHHMSNADLNRLTSLQPPNNMHSNHPHEHNVHSPGENHSQHQTQAAESNSVERHSIQSSDPYKLEVMQ